MTLGGRIREAREACGLTQLAVAYQLGVTPQTVANWETGRTSPALPVLARIARQLNTTMVALMEGLR